MTSADALTRAIETILVDFYNEDEDYTAFLTVIEDEVALPASASLLGTPVTVVRLDYTDPARGLVAVCRGPHGTGQVTFADLVFPRRHGGRLAARRLPPPPRPQTIPCHLQTRLDLATRLTASGSSSAEGAHRRTTRARYGDNASVLPVSAAPSNPAGIRIAHASC